MPEQKSVKPKVEDAILQVLSGDRESAALDFAAFMQENKLSLRWASNNAWKAMYKGKSVCYMLINAGGDWVIRFSQFTREKWFVDYDSHITDAGLKDFVINNINSRNCPGRDCGITRNKTILGKTFEEVCTCWPIYMRNPGGTDLEDVKKLILVIKMFITGSKL